MGDQITEIRIAGLRTLADVKLKLNGLTVLIGENATGKSSILEACEILRRIPGQRFFEELHGIHGGLSALLRVGADRLTLGVSVRGDGPPLEYDLTIAQDRHAPVIAAESLRVGPIPGHDGPLNVIQRDRQGTRVFDQAKRELTKVDLYYDRVALGAYGQFPPQEAFGRLLPHLENISVHPPFHVLATWAAKSTGLPSRLRSPIPFEPADRLETTGFNLANAYAALKNDFSGKHWEETMDYVRLGLGYDIESVNVKADPGGGHVGLSIKYAALDRQIAASSLSDGTLSFLALVAAVRLGKKRSLLAMDEPEAHFHPGLQVRVVELLEQAAETHPVLLATHSDRVLDALSDPSSSVVLCELDEHKATRLLRPDKAALDDWLGRYAGLGEIRAAGHEGSIMVREEAP